MNGKSGSVSMTSGSISKSIINFAIPIFFGNLFQQLYNTVDSLVVGRFLDENALAAVSSSGPLIFLLVGFFNGVATGAGVLISKYYGAKDNDSVEAAVHTDIAFGLIMGIVLTVVGVALTPQILIWMGTPQSVLPNSIVYFRIYFLGSLALVMYNTNVGILQAVGDSRHPLYYLIFSSILNVILDILFIGVMGFGVGSAAFATVLSQFVSAVLSTVRLVRSDTVCRVNLRSIRIDRRMLSRIIKLGLPSGVQNSMISIANIFVQSNINAFDVNAVAGCGSYSKLEGFAFLPITSLAVSMTTFIGQNLGARQFERAKKGARFGIFASMLLAETVGVIIYVFSPQLIALFKSDPEIVRFGVLQARTEGLFYLFLAFSHCIAGIMRGAGKAVVPMLTMMACWCVIRVTYITLMIRIIPNIQVVFWAYPLTWTLSSIVFLIYFLKADWVHGFEKKSAAEN
ncbi:MAG: MATE family efflux transporter [Ruminococcaceae bacterium]|nr:MATE family efflux transporter [Oscillospiraceae bacterium]